MELLSRFMLWIAVAAWVSVAAAFVAWIRRASGFSFSGNRHGMTGRMEPHQPPENHDHRPAQHDMERG